MTLFWPEFLLSLCDPGCCDGGDPRELSKWLWVRRCGRRLATARHPASRNSATTGTQESVCSLCGQLHIFSSPWKQIKKAARKSGLSPTSQVIMSWAESRAERLRLCTRGGWFPWVGTEAHRQEMPTVPQPWGEGNDTGLTAAMTAATPPQTCWAVTLGRRKTQNKFHVVFPTWWLHPILGLSQACHPLSRSHGK